VLQCGGRGGAEELRDAARRFSSSQGQRQGLGSDGIAPPLRKADVRAPAGGTTFSSLHQYLSSDRLRDVHVIRSSNHRLNPTTSM